MSLQELENKFWPDFEYPTNLVKRCHDLRKLPLKNFDIDDIRFMIIQNEGNEYLIPMALEALEQNILVEGNLFAGDLLMSVLMASPDFWRRNPPLWKRTYELVGKNLEVIQDSAEQEIK